MRQMSVSLRQVIYVHYINVLSVCPRYYSPARYVYGIFRLVDTSHRDDRDASGIP